MNFSAVQIAMVAAIALIVFGPSRLPEIGRQIGRGLREARRQVGEVTGQFSDATDDFDVETDPSPRASTTSATDDAAAPSKPTVSDDDLELLKDVVMEGTPPVGGSDAIDLAEVEHILAADDPSSVTVPERAA